MNMCFIIGAIAGAGIVGTYLEYKRYCNEIKYSNNLIRIIKMYEKKYKILKRWEWRGK